MGSAQHSVHPISGKERRSHTGTARQCRCGGGTAARRDCVRTPFGQSGSLRSLKLVPSKWRDLVPPTSTPEGV